MDPTKQDPQKFENKPAPTQKAKELTKGQIEEALCIFKSFDANNDGYLTHDELDSRLSDLGYGDSEIQDLIMEMDGDGDGKVTIDEFTAVFMDFIGMDEEEEGGS